MFGFTNEQATLYREHAQDYAMRDVAPMVIGAANFMVPAIDKGKGKEPEPVPGFVSNLVLDIQTIITLATTHMAYDYAHMQHEGTLEEKEILGELHSRYEEYIFRQFIKYGVTGDLKLINRIIGEIILELPYLYSHIAHGEDADEDEFLEEKMAAYEEYLEDNFSDVFEEIEIADGEDDGEEDEEEEEELEDDED